MRLIDADTLKNAKPEFMNEKVVRNTKYRTTRDRVYAKAWNDCNSYWLNAIQNIPTVDTTSQEVIAYEHAQNNKYNVSYLHQDSITKTER